MDFGDIGTEQAIAEGFGDLITEWFKDTNPDGPGRWGDGVYRPYNTEWGPNEGFGPGYYDDTYTGEGDAIHWGGFDGDEDDHPNRRRHDEARAARDDGKLPGFGPGGAVKSGIGLSAGFLEGGAAAGGVVPTVVPDLPIAAGISPSDLPMPPQGHPGLPDPPTGEPIVGEPSISYSGDGSR